MKTRLVPALALFVLTPLIAEYLLGSLSVKQFTALPVLCFMYGGGTVLLREAIRTAGRGWGNIILLGAAYALLEEGIATQSLFNPHYLNLSLLDYGYLPWLGTSANWSAYVLSLHVIWSICVPIAFVEALFPHAAKTPWLGTLGRSVFGLLFVTGVVAVTAFSAKTGGHFIASPVQLGVTAALIVAFAIVGLCWRAKSLQAGSPLLAPHPGVVVLFTLALGSVFCLTQGLKGRGVPWPVPVVVIVAIDALAIWRFWAWGSRTGWSRLHVAAAAAGGLLTYCWYGYGVEMSLHGQDGLVAHSILVALALALLAYAYRASGKRAWKGLDDRARCP